MKNCLPQRRMLFLGSGFQKNHSKKLGGAFLFLLTLVSSFLFAQTTITGRVAAGDTALAGVTVQVKGTNNATQTNSAGRFSINAPAEGSLVFTYIGYAPQEVAIGSRTTVDVQLQSTGQQLTDVVVVGYATQRRATVTGSVSSVSAKDLISTPATTTSGALVGKVQGITTRSPDSRPGRGVNIQIRNMGNPVL